MLPADAAGTFRIIAVADANNEVVEINETNNLSTPSQAFTLGGDLIVVIDLPAASSALPVGATFTIEEATSNRGGTAVGAFTTNFYLSADTVFDAGDQLLGSRSILGLAAGERNPPSGLDGDTADAPAGDRGKVLRDRRGRRRSHRGREQRGE